VFEVLFIGFKEVMKFILVIYGVL